MHADDAKPECMAPGKASGCNSFAKSCDSRAVPGSNVSPLEHEALDHLHINMFSNLCSWGHPSCQVETKAFDMAHILVMYPMEAAALEMQRLPRLLSCSSFSSA